jgi:hypothetical protein
MSAKRGQGNTLGIAVAIAAVVVALMILAATKVRLPKSDTKVPKPATASVAIARADPRGGSPALLEQVELYDPKPLFLPTLINNSDPNLPAMLRREPGTVFQSFPAGYVFDEYEMKKVAFPEPITVPATPVEVLHTGEIANPFFTFGRINYPYTPLSKRLAFLEVMQARTGKTVLAVPLVAQKSDNLPGGDWPPLEMMVAIETTGMVGEPTVTSGSGSDEIDDFFRAFLVKQFRLGSRLPPGFYTLRVGP